MAIDYSALLYDPLYAELGVPALFAAAGTAGEVAITVIDDTKPKTATAASAASSAQLDTRGVEPGAFARIPELAVNGIAEDDWIGATLTFNGRAWTVRNFELRGSPNGEDLGEVRFLLKAIAASAGDEYEGPLDVVSSAVLAFGNRALSSAMRGSALYEIRKGVGASETFDSDAVTGAAPSAAIVSFLDVDEGLVLSWKDQSGDGRDLPGASGNEPKWVANQLDGKPAIGQSGTFAPMTPSIPMNGGATMFAVVEKSMGFELGSGFGPYMNASFATDNFSVSGNSDINYAEGACTSGDIDDFAIVDTAWEYGSRSLMINGVSQTFTTEFDEGGPFGEFTLAAMTSLISLSTDSYVVEALVWPSVLTLPQRAAIRQNIATYYGIALA